MQIPSRINELLDAHIELQQSKLEVDREILIWLQDNAGVNLYNPSQEEKEVIDSLNISCGCERTKSIISSFIENIET